MPHLRLVRDGPGGRGREDRRLGPECPPDRAGRAGDDERPQGGTQTKTFIAGVASTGVNGTTVEIDVNGQLWVSPSSARYKRDIAAMGTRSEGVLQLRPVTFAYRDDAQNTVH